jgi:hypothetical protein
LVDVLHIYHTRHLKSDDLIIIFVRYVSSNTEMDEIFKYVQNHKYNRCTKFYSLLTYLTSQGKGFMLLTEQDASPGENIPSLKIPTPGNRKP